MGQEFKCGVCGGTILFDKGMWVRHDCVLSEKEELAEQLTVMMRQVIGANFNIHGNHQMTRALHALVRSKGVSEVEVIRCEPDWVDHAILRICARCGINEAKHGLPWFRPCSLDA